MFSRIADFWLSRKRPLDEKLWHKWNTVWPVPLVNGGRYDGAGQLWRRRTATGWEYKADPRTYEDWIELQY
jgi:hypothetical protein